MTSFYIQLEIVMLEIRFGITSRDYSENKRITIINYIIQ